MENHELEALSKQSYEEIEESLQSLTLDHLLRALDCKSNRVGDMAAHVLERRNAFARVAQALLNRKLKRAIGRVRGTSILFQQGLTCPENVTVFEHLLTDRSYDVVGNALFGLAFFRSRRSLPRIREVYRSLARGDKRAELFEKAIEAIEKDDPSIYSPGFRDAAGVWQVDKASND